MPSAPALVSLATQSKFRSIPRWLAASLMLAILQPILDHIVAYVAQSRPELFARLGEHGNKRFLIDPVELPFPLYLVLDAARPRLMACDRHECPVHDARIAGAFLDLLDMISGSVDGDALFFNRGLSITGDVEAVVALRNALDDFDGSLVDTIAGAFGPLSSPARFALSALDNYRSRNHRA